MAIKKFKFNYSFSHVPPVMHRGTHALAVLMDKKGNYILGGKEIYPPGIYRLIGGGVNTNEMPIEGLLRELEEETGLTPKKSAIKPLTQITAICTDDNKRKFTFHTNLFLVKADPNKIKPDTDLDEIKVLSKIQMKSLISKYQKLPTKLVYLSKIPNTEFRWSDYGKFFSQVHQIALDLTT